MEELAQLVGQDPLAYRLAHLDDERGRRVLETVAEAAGWGQDTPEGVGRGMGFARYKDRAPTAQWSRRLRPSTTYGSTD
jgi:hypothetical protein